MSFIDAHTTLKNYMFFWAVPTLQALFCVLPTMSFILKNLVFIIIGTGAIWIASMLPICTLDQVGRLDKLILQLAGVFKCLPEEARRLEGIF